MKLHTFFIISFVLNISIITYQIIEKKRMIYNIFFYLSHLVYKKPTILEISKDLNAIFCNLDRTTYKSTNKRYHNYTTYTIYSIINRTMHK